MKIKKVMKQEVKEHLAETIIEYAKKNGLTISNIKEVEDLVVEYMRNNATVANPKDQVVYENSN